MKICWDNLEGMVLTKKGNFRIGRVVYIEMDSCKKCGESFLCKFGKVNDYCSRSCAKKAMIVRDETRQKIKDIMAIKHPWTGRKHTDASREKMKKSQAGRVCTEATKLLMSEQRGGEKNVFFGKHHTEETKALISSKNKGKLVGEKNPSYKGGVRKLGLAAYDTYALKLEWCEEVRPIEHNGFEILQVRCTNSNCNQWFTPTYNQVYNRLQVINGKIEGNNRFYCCDECKESCSIFNKSVVEQEKQFTPYELSIWSKTVLTRHEFICEYCGETANTAHHIIPKKLAPFYALDPDNGISCCEECHYKYGHTSEECRTVYIAKTVCTAYKNLYA